MHQDTLKWPSGLRGRIAFTTICAYIVMSYSPLIFSLGEIAVSAVLVASWIPLIPLAARVSMRCAAKSGNSAPTLVIVASGMALIFISIWSATYAIQPFKTARVFYPHLSGIALLTVWLAFCSHRAVNDKLAGLVAIMGLFSSLAAIGSMHIPQLSMLILQENGRSMGLFKHPNQLGMAISSTAPIAVAWAYRKGGVAAALTAGPLLFLGAIYSGSKTNLVLTILACAPVYILIALTTKNSFLRVLMVCSAVALATIVLPAALGLIETLNPRAYRILTGLVSGDTSEAGSLYTRMILWRKSIELGVDNPLLGVGAGQPIGIWPHSHNLYLDYFRTLGFPGLILIAFQTGAVLIVSVRTLWRAMAKTRVARDFRISVGASGCSLIMFILANQTSESFGPNTTPLYWIFIALALCFSANFYSLEHATQETSEAR